MDNWLLLFKILKWLFLDHCVLLFGILLGAAYARAEEEIKEFVTNSNLPFLPTPMGKGVIPDTHPLCVAAARSK